MNRALFKIDELFGESTPSSESEEETVGDIARATKLKGFYQKGKEQLQIKLLKLSQKNRKLQNIQLE